MDQSEREDCLEAIIMHSAEGKEAETVSILAGALEIDVGEVSALLDTLEKEEDIISGPGGSISLTEKGRATGESVLKKHRILECFFTEMLGMDPDTASKEACEMEHSASEYTINRIGSFISGRRGRCRTGHGAACGNLRAPGECRFTVLDDFEEGDVVRIVGIRAGPGGGRRLADLGIVPGEKIKLVRRLPGGSVLVMIKGCEVAISPEIAGRVMAEKAV